MKIIYLSANWEIGTKFKREMEKKIHKLEQKYQFIKANDEVRIKVELLKNLHCQVKVELYSIQLNKVFVALAETENIYESLSKAIQKLNTQILKIKEKFQN